ncbi:MULTISPECIES: hypothetical protein [Agrobacterium]|nr:MULTISPECIES: hypothetical protein [Agrobacterium]
MSSIFGQKQGCRRLKFRGFEPRLCGKQLRMRDVIGGMGALAT